MNDTLLIELHRDDRTYRSGEPVRGEVVIYTDHGGSCGGVYLMRYWRTRGRGEMDRGDRRVLPIHEGPLDGPGPYRVPFEFEAPGGPFTYHGALLNVDHYLEARVEVPGLFDPGRPEKYTLVPGSEVDPPHPELLKVTGAKSSGARGCRIMIGALLMLFGFFTLPFGVILLIPGLFLAFPALTRAVAGSRIGEVSSTTRQMIIRPGRALRVQTRLNPKKARTINAATAVLRGREIVISGEGNERQVHEHELHTREVSLSGPRELAAGRPATLDAEFEIPDGAAYTFASEHNEVTWEVTVSVDIPTWPDWHQEHKVVVWPPGATEEDEAGDEAAASSLLAAAASVDAPEPLRSPTSPEPLESPGSPESREPAEALEPPPVPEPLEAREPPSSPDALPVPGASDPGGPPDAGEPVLPRRDRDDAGSREPPAAAVPAPPELPSGSAASLATAVSRILEEKSFGGGRDPLVRALVGQRFTFDLEVGLVEHTFGAGPDPTYRHGRTVTGSVEGTGISVEVRFPSERNDEVDGYRRGAVHTVSATVVDWEKLAEKPVLEA